jgi:hypothetical protein
MSIHDEESVKLNTGYTQKNGAVSLYSPLKPHHSFVYILYFRRFKKIAKNDYQIRHVCPSFRTEQLGCHWTDFWENFTFEYFSKICRKYSSFVKI